MVGFLIDWETTNSRGDDWENCFYGSNLLHKFHCGNAAGIKIGRCLTCSIPTPFSVSIFSSFWDMFSWCWYCLSRLSSLLYSVRSNTEKKMKYCTSWVCCNMVIYTFLFKVFLMRQDQRETSRITDIQWINSCRIADGCSSHSMFVF